MLENWNNEKETFQGTTAGRSWKCWFCNIWNDGMMSRKSFGKAELDFRGSSKNYKNQRFFIFREKVGISLGHTAYWVLGPFISSLGLSVSPLFPFLLLTLFDF